MVRLKYLNDAKALGIILVIVEHVIASYSFMQPVTVCILAFHMPLFFVISGYQYALKEKVEGISKKFVQKRAKRLLIPYAIFVGCILLYKIPFTLMTEHQISLDFIKYMAQNIFVTGYGVGWFLVALFYSELLFKTAFLTDKASVHKAVAIASCILGILFSFGQSVFLQLIARVLIACTFLWAGYFAGKLKLLSKLPTYAFAGVFVFSLMLSLLNGQCSMMGVSFGVSKLLFVYNAVAMSLSFLGLIKMLESRKLPFFEVIGAHTLIIMLTHTYIILIIKWLTYLVLPHSTTGDILSIVCQLFGAIAAEMVIVLIMQKINRRKNRTQIAGR